MADSGNTAAVVTADTAAAVTGDAAAELQVILLQQIL